MRDAVGSPFPRCVLQRLDNVRSLVLARALDKHFGDDIPETIIEPGRGMVGNAGVIETEVVLISTKSADGDGGAVRWVYFDVGKFGGLAETMDASIRYEICTPRDNDGSGVSECIIAGPTCDSADILYEKRPYELPDSLASRCSLFFFSLSLSVSFLIP